MPEITRRQAMSMLAVTVAGGALLPRAAFAQDNLMDADVCVIVPEVTEGPYYFDPALLRADITEGRPGLPMTLKMQVVDQACAPARRCPRRRLALRRRRRSTRATTASRARPSCAAPRCRTPTGW